MTKPKGVYFAGAWMDARIPTDQITARLANERGAVIKAKPVLVALKRQVENRRFALARYKAELPPAQWLATVQAITVPDHADAIEVMALYARIIKLPYAVRAWLDTYLFKACERGYVQLFEQWRQHYTPESATLLRTALAAVAADAARVRGKRGPRLSVGEAVAEITAVLMANAIRLRPVPARELAAELLRMVGVPAPEGRRRLTTLAPSRKRGRNYCATPPE